MRTIMGGPYVAPPMRAVGEIRRGNVSFGAPPGPPRPPSASTASRLRLERSLHDSPGLRSDRTPYWIPAWLLALGLLSIVLLAGTRRIDERRANDAAMANVVMDLRIRVATAQLWTEEIISGRRGRGQRALAESALLDAAHLADVLGSGGEGKDFLMMDPPAPAMRARAEQLRAATAEWAALARVRLRPSEAVERDAADDGLARAFDFFEGKAAELERVVESEQLADVVRARRLFQGLALVWSVIIVASVTTLLRREEGRARVDDELRAGRIRLEAMVLERTRDLRAVNVALLSAQETERRRIASELHDQLGHALIVMKLRFALIGRQFSASQAKARAECGELCDYIDQTLNDVRRLARDLTPSVLEELGLSAALRWLADTSRNEGRPISTAVGQVDAFVPKDSQIIVYRIMQQAVVNAVRHSGAHQISLTAVRHGDQLRFVVEDDGKGFDVSATTADAGREGLGVTTMRQRASMVGGTLELWSEPGKGTRVTLGIPVPLLEGT